MDAERYKEIRNEIDSFEVDPLLYWMRRALRAEQENKHLRSMQVPRYRRLSLYSLLTGRE